MKPTIKLFAIFVFTLISCGIQTEETKPVKKDIAEAVFASGILEANGTYTLTARTDGYIIDLKFKENDIIMAGQLLALIDNRQNNINAESGMLLYEIAQLNIQPTSPQFVQAENEMQKAKQKMEYDLGLLKRYKIMHEAKSISDVDFQKIELQFAISKTEYENSLQNYSLVKQKAEQQLVINRAQKDINKILSTHNQIIAIRSGRVLKQFKQIGDFVSHGEAIAIIGDADSIYAKVNIDEESINKIKVGQDALVQLNINKNKTYKGKVLEILPTFDESTQSFTCKISFMDQLDFRIIGTQLQTNIKVGVFKNALLIPRKYIGYDNEVRIKGESLPKKVETKIVSSEWVQVLSGIDENTILVTNYMN